MHHGPSRASRTKCITGAQVPESCVTKTRGSPTNAGVAAAARGAADICWRGNILGAPCRTSAADWPLCTSWGCQRRTTGVDECSHPRCELKVMRIPAVRSAGRRLHPDGHLQQVATYFLVDLYCGASTAARPAPPVAPGRMEEARSEVRDKHSLECAISWAVNASGESLGSVGGEQAEQVLFHVHQRSPAQAPRPSYCAALHLPWQCARCVLGSALTHPPVRACCSLSGTQT